MSTLATATGVHRRAMAIFIMVLGGVAFVVSLVSVLYGKVSPVACLGAVACVAAGAALLIPRSSYHLTAAGLIWNHPRGPTTIAWNNVRDVLVRTGFTWDAELRIRTRGLGRLQGELRIAVPCDMDQAVRLEQYITAYWKAHADDEA